MGEKYFEDYDVGAVHTTTGRTITESDIVVHAGHTGDFFPHHMDAEFARTTRFGQRVAHGTMIFAIGIGLTAMQIGGAALVLSSILISQLRSEEENSAVISERAWK